MKMPEQTTKRVRLGEVPAYPLQDLLEETITGEWGEECADNEGVGVLRTTNFVNDGTIDYSQVVRRSIPQQKVESKKLRCGDLIVEKSGGTKDHPVGRVVYFDKANDVFLCNNFTQIIRPDQTKAFPRYLFFALMASYQMKVTESMYNKTTGIQNLQMRRYLAQIIPLPPLAEQKRIAEVLDKISAMKRNAEARVQKLDLLVKSRFVEMFGDPVTNPKGWSVARIEEFADVKIGPFGSVLHKDDYVFGGHALVNPSHMFDGKIVPDESLTLSEERYSELPAYHLHRGDVVVARRGEIGRCALVECDGLFCGTGSMYIRITKNCRPDFLQRVISFPTYAAKLEFGAVGVTMKNINAGMVADSVVPLPPMEVQNEFAAFVEKVEALKATAQRECEQVDLLYRAKLQEYFG